MKTYIIILSDRFPKKHAKTGNPTLFKEKFLIGQGIYTKDVLFDIDKTKFPKIHTIRTNYFLWEKRIEKVQNGDAILSIRQWSGKPYASKQIRIKDLTYHDGVGIQKLCLFDLFKHGLIEDHKFSVLDLASNDGLFFGDWYYWFKNYDLKQPLAIIHFTNFRYL